MYDLMLKFPFPFNALIILMISKHSGLSFDIIIVSHIQICKSYTHKDVWQVVYDCQIVCVINLLANGESHR